MQSSDSGLAVTILGEDEFSSCGKSWNRLLDASTSESFFLRWEWLYTFWETIDREDASLLVCFCHDGPRLVGVAPLYVFSSKFMGFSVRKIAFLGDRVASDYLDIFTQPGYEERCCSAVVNMLRTSDATKFTMLEFDGVCADSNIYRHLGEPGGAGIVVLPRFECPRALLSAGFDEYLKKLSSSTRYYLGRKQRKLEKNFADMEVRHVDFLDSAGLLEVLFDLHERRWRTLVNRSSTFSSAFRKEFNNRLLERTEKGDGFFSGVWINGKPASIMYTFLYKGNAYFYQNGWDPEYAPYSIGIYNIQEAMRYAVGKGCKTFDFLRGPERYKYMYCDDVRQAYAVVLFTGRLPGRCLEGLLRLKQQLKRILNRQAVPGLNGAANCGRTEL
jgi:CelD/BcsL family acetyltransferase involved in cellulose biosynthesis